MFQWANTLTTSGQNMPFVLPQKVDRTANGFTMSFLKANPQDQFVSVGDIEAEVESIAGTCRKQGCSRQSASDVNERFSSYRSLSHTLGISLNAS